MINSYRYPPGAGAGARALQLTETLFTPILATRSCDRFYALASQMAEAEKKDQMKKVNGIFEMHVTNGGKEGVYTIDLKKVKRRLPGSGPSVPY